MTPLKHRLEDGRVNESLVDPDPWTVINLGLIAVGSIGTFAQAVMMYGQTRGATRSRNSTSDLEKLDEGLRDATRVLERLIKLLARQGVQDKPVLERPFSYGASPMLLEQEEFMSFQKLFGDLASALIQINGSASIIMRFDKPLADALGLAILNENEELSAEINGFYRGTMTNGQVLDRAIAVLRSFERILGRISASN
jgi:hypothetical protein